MLVELTDELYIGSGHKRICYQLPDDPAKLVKIERTDNPDKNDNLIESLYYEHLQKRGIDFSHLAQYYGWIDTTKGPGLVFERIVNHDGSIPLTLDSMIKQKTLLPKTELDNLVKQLGAYLRTNQILFADVGLGNILCQQVDSSSWKLVIIDGLGSTKMDFRFRLRMLIPIYNRYKIAIQWKRFVKSYQKKFV